MIYEKRRERFNRYKDTIQFYRLFFSEVKDVSVHCWACYVSVFRELLNNDYQTVITVVSVYFLERRAFSKLL